MSATDAATELRRAHARIRALEVEVDELDHYGRVNADELERDARAGAISDVLAILDDLDRGIIDPAELRRRVEALRP